MKGKSKGSLVLTLIFGVVILGSMTRLFMAIVTEAIQSQQEINFRRELLRVGGDLITAVADKPAFHKKGTITLPTIVFNEGCEELTPKVTVDVLPKAHLRSVSVELKGETVHWRTRKIFLEPPGGKKHPVYSQEYYEGSEDTKKLMPILSHKEYSKYQDFPLPKREDLQEAGLSGFVYSNQQGTLYPQDYRLPVTGTVFGSGVIYNARKIILGPKTHLTGKIWLLSQDDIVLEDDVYLEQAFLYSAGNIYLGHRARVCGIIVAANKLVKGTESAFQKNPAVLEPFVTPIYAY